MLMIFNITNILKYKLIINLEEFDLYLFSYDISGKKDPHGLRVRLNYFFKKTDAFHLLRSIWLINERILELNDFKELLNELKLHNFPYILVDTNEFHYYNNKFGEKFYNLGIVIHGPEVIDLGILGSFIKELKNNNVKFKCLLGGTMGKIAVIDSKLDDIVPLSLNYKPSQCIDYFLIHNFDAIIVLNHARSKKSGIECGHQVLSMTKLAPFFKKTPILHLDLLKTKNAFCIPWNDGDVQLLNWISAKFNLQILNPKEIMLEKQSKLDEVNGKIIRKISPVEIGDLILISGHVMGKIIEKDVTITTLNNKILEEETRGINIVHHGLEKLGKIDLKNARITTLKSLRRTTPPGFGSKKYKKSKKATIIRKAENILPFINKIDTFITIGDDTTYLSHQFLKRFPKKNLIGFIDMDSEFHQNVNFMDLYPDLPLNFKIIRVKEATDDIVGFELQRNFFKNHKFLKYDTFKQLFTQINDFTKEWFYCN